MDNVFGRPTEMDRLNEVTRRRIERGDPNPYRRITPHDDGYNDVPYRPPQWFNNIRNTAWEWYNNQRPSRYTPYMEGLNNQEEEEEERMGNNHPVLPPPPPNNGMTDTQIPEPTEAKEGDLACIICMENIADHCIVPCGHISLCVVCSDRLKHQPSFPKCPTCRASITDIIQTFSVGVPYHAGGRKTKKSKRLRKLKKSRKSHK